MQTESRDAWRPNKVLVLLLGDGRPAILFAFFFTAIVTHDQSAIECDGEGGRVSAPRFATISNRCDSTSSLDRQDVKGA